MDNINDIERLITKIDENIKLLCDDLIAEAPNELKLLFKSFQDFALRPGKRIRPTLLVLTYKGYGGSNELDAVRLGAAVEVIHSFLLVHDDIIDNSEVRRGKPTLHKTYEKIFNSPKLGVDTAIVVGDVISFFFVGIISRFEVSDATRRNLLKSFSDCYVKTCYGQLLDIISANRINDENITSNIPEKISEMKTAYYTFVYPMLMGYYLAGKSDMDEIDMIISAGRYAGIGFQYKDDIIGIFGGDAKTLNDLSEGKLTSMVKKTYEILEGKDKETFTELITKKEKTQTDVEILKNLITKSNAKEKLIEEINMYKKNSLQFLDRLKMNEKEKDMLKKIISNVLETY